jgi:hypothetical protein
MKTRWIWTLTCVVALLAPNLAVPVVAAQCATQQSENGACCCPMDTCPAPTPDKPGLNGRCCIAPVPESSTEAPRSSGRLVEAGSAPGVAADAPLYADVVPAVSSCCEQAVPRPTESPPRYDLFCSYLI